MKKNFLFFVTLGTVLAVSPAFARSDGFAGDPDRECGIWICLPQGFAGDDSMEHQIDPAADRNSCSKSFTAYLKRITTFTHGHHPKRVYTSLPGFKRCEDRTDYSPLQAVGLTKDDILSMQKGQGQATYTERDDAHIPDHDECEVINPVYRWRGDDRELVGWSCGKWRHVDEHYVQNKVCDLTGHDGSPFKFGAYLISTLTEGQLYLDDYYTGQHMLSFDDPAWCDYTVTSTDEYDPQGQHLGETYMQAHNGAKTWRVRRNADSN